MIPTSTTLTQLVNHSRLSAGAQYERSFLAHRLGNWEIADATKSEATSLKNRFDRTAPRTKTTEFIVQENGYLKPEHKKAGVTAFTTTHTSSRPIYAATKPRWPTVCIPPDSSGDMHQHTREHLLQNSSLARAVVTCVHDTGGTHLPADEQSWSFASSLPHDCPLPCTSRLLTAVPMASASRAQHSVRNADECELASCIIGDNGL